jgi:phosphatidylglycerophosphatase A
MEVPMTRPGGTRRLAYLVATVGGVGRIPVVPGTFGTLAAVPLAWLAAVTSGPLLFGCVLAAVALLGTWAAGVVEQEEGSSDPSMVVVDEVAGFLATVAFLPPSLLTYLAAFLLFRVLDITKPFPARRAEKFHGGLGIMADDLIVGVYGNLILRAGLLLIGRT